MRFEDMVLTMGQLLVVFQEGKVSAIQAQHEADMAQEVDCPCNCGGDHDNHDCTLCSGTGRVTLGRIVEWSRGLERG